MPWSNITSGLAAERLSLHGDGKAPTNQAHMLPTGLGSTAALRAVMVAATPTNWHPSASTVGMSKPGSDPRGTGSDDFPARRVVTVMCKH